jgi:hypothetical protein
VSADLRIDIVPTATNTPAEQAPERRQVFVQVLLVLAARKLREPAHASDGDRAVWIELARMAHDARRMRRLRAAWAPTGSLDDHFAHVCAHW